MTKLLLSFPCCPVQNLSPQCPVNTVTTCSRFHLNKMWAQGKLQDLPGTPARAQGLGVHLGLRLEVWTPCVCA